MQYTYTEGSEEGGRQLRVIFLGDSLKNHIKKKRQVASLLMVPCRAFPEVQKRRLEESYKEAQSRWADLFQEPTLQTIH